MTRALGPVLVVLALLAATPAVARFLPGPPPVSLLASFAPWAVPATVLVLVAALGLRRWLAALVPAVALVAQAVVAGPLVVSDEPGSGTRLVVLSANVRLGLADAAALVGVVRSSGVQVLAVQELTPAFQSALLGAGLETLLPHRVSDPRGGASGAGLWSSLPLTRAASWPSTLGNVAATVELAGQSLLLRNLHPHPPSLLDNERWDADFAGFTRLARGGPRTLVLGDLNATVHHVQLRRLMAAGGWRDAAEVAGQGLLRTWGPSLDGPLLVGIDHVLVPAGAGVGSVRAVPVAGSDHRALLAEVVL